LTIFGLWHLNWWQFNSLLFGSCLVVSIAHLLNVLNLSNGSDLLVLVLVLEFELLQLLVLLVVGLKRSSRGTCQWHYHQH
jgi:hypothetical protein